MNTIELQLFRILQEQVEMLRRPDLFRSPLIAFSSAGDARYQELKTMVGPWHRSPQELLPGAQTVISCFVPFTQAVAASPLDPREPLHLWGEAYEVINARYDHIGAAIREYLQACGYESFPVPSTHTYDPKDLQCYWSHRSAACIAGLGTFGANRLLITEKGSAGRFCTVLTTAPLPTRRLPPKVQCPYFSTGACGACLQACPVSALRPHDFARFDCLEELFRNMDHLQTAYGYVEADVCGKCISACPYACLK